MTQSLREARISTSVHTYIEATPGEDVKKSLHLTKLHTISCALKSASGGFFLSWEHAESEVWAWLSMVPCSRGADPAILVSVVPAFTSFRKQHPLALGMKP